MRDRWLLYAAVGLLAYAVFVRGRAAGAAWSGSAVTPTDPVTGLPITFETGPYPSPDFAMLYGSPEAQEAQRAIAESRGIIYP